MAQPIIHCDPDIQGGVPVFHGTRVPVKNLFDYLEAATPLTSFCAHSPQCHGSKPLPRLNWPGRRWPPMRILLDESLLTAVPLRAARL